MSSFSSVAVISFAHIQRIVRNTKDCRCVPSLWSFLFYFASVK